jgi:hypothetical protein
LQLRSYEFLGCVLGASRVWDYEVEFVTLDSETIAVVSLFAAQVRPIGPREIALARVMA